MRIGILQADSVLEQFQPTHGNYPEMIAEVLGDAAASIDIDATFTTYDVEHFVYPSNVHDCDGYVITGSRKSVYDDEPWIHRLHDYVRELDAQRVRVAGICFGHQLIAHALGGKTEPADSGWGVGVHEYEVEECLWFMDESPSYSLIVSHKDQVSQLPAEARRLATSDFCPNAMFCLGDHMFALQGHPEFKPAYSQDLMNMRKDILGPETYVTGMASLEQPLDRHQVSQWIVRFLKGPESA